MQSINVIITNKNIIRNAQIQKLSLLEQLENIKPQKRDNFYQLNSKQSIKLV